MRFSRTASSIPSCSPQPISAHLLASTPNGREAPSEQWTSQLYRANSNVGFSQRREGMNVSTCSIQFVMYRYKDHSLHRPSCQYPPHQQHQLPTGSSQQSLIRQPTPNQQPTASTRTSQHTSVITQQPNQQTQHSFPTSPRCPSPPASPTTPPPPAGGPVLTPPSPRRWSPR